jgi:hypothetical protein
MSKVCRFYSIHWIRGWTYLVVIITGMVGRHFHFDLGSGVDCQNWLQSLTEETPVDIGCGQGQVDRMNSRQAGEQQQTRA